jgi:hypothetical protein
MHPGEDRCFFSVAIGTPIRAARAAIEQPIPVNPVSGQCRLCGERMNHGQARQ